MLQKQNLYLSRFQGKYGNLVLLHLRWVEQLLGVCMHGGAGGSSAVAHAGLVVLERQAVLALELVDEYDNTILEAMFNTYDETSNVSQACACI